MGPVNVCCLLLYVGAWPGYINDVWMKSGYQPAGVMPYPYQQPWHTLRPRSFFLVAASNE